MKKLWFIPIALFGLMAFVGCSSAPAEEPAPKGAKPEVIQADPNQVPPEQRVGAQRSEGSEGDAD